MIEPCEIVEHPYAYWGWLIENTLTTEANIPALEVNIEAFLEAYELIETTPEAAIPLCDSDWVVTPGTGNAGNDKIYRLREGIERFLITDIDNPAGSAQAQSEIAIMWDEISDEAAHFNHIPGGCNVLYMDGHVDFLRYMGPYGNKFPVNKGGLLFHEVSHACAGHDH